MKRLGIAIKSTLQGSGEAIKVNPGPWDNRIVDVRDVLRHVPSLSTDSNRSVIFLSFGELGSYITVARCFPNREGDNIAGWIFVPNDIQISGDEVCHMVDEVRNIIFMSELPARDKLDSIFSKEFPLKAAATPCKPSPKNGKFAKREITEATPLKVLLGSAIYQPVYDKYQDVFITQFKDEVNDAIDLTGLPLTQMAVLQPPAPEALVLAGQGTVIHFAKNNEVFDHPIQVPKGTLVDLKAVRPGFASESFSIRVEGDNTRCPLPKFLWKPVPGAGAAGETPQQQELPTWNIELANGQNAQIMIKGRVSRGVSPLKGYELVGRKTLEYKGGGWKDRMVGFGSALVLGIVVCGILALCGVFGSDRHKEALAENEGTENVDENGFSKAEGSADTKGMSKAIEYLDSHNNWSKSEMDKIPDLKDLFDALNTYDTSAIARLQVKLSGSKKLKAIAELMDKNSESIPTGSFDANGSSINVQQYEDALRGSYQSNPIPGTAPVQSNTVSTVTTTTTGTYTGGGGSNSGSLNVRQAPAGGGRKASAPAPAANSKPATATQHKPATATQPKPATPPASKPAPTPKPTRGELN